jgi:hypothetical protein
MINEADEVTSFPALMNELGLNHRQRVTVLQSGVLTPVDRRQGHPTLITTEDAGRIEKAAAIAALTGIAVVIILRLLASGTVTPNVP